MKFKKLITYYVSCLVPSYTATYIFLHDYVGWGVVTAYVTGSLIMATIYIPINKYIFKNGEHL